MSKKLQLNQIFNKLAKIKSVLILATLLNSSVAANSEVKEICYTERFESFIGCVSPDGTNGRTVATFGISEPKGFDINNSTGSLYLNGIGSVSRIKLNGTEHINVFSDYASRLIKLNVGRNLLYRINPETGHDNISAHTIGGAKIAQTNDKSLFGILPGFGKILSYDATRDILVANRLISNGFPNAHYEIVKLSALLDNLQVIVSLGKDTRGYPIEPTALTIDESKGVVYYTTHNRTENKTRFHSVNIDGTDSKVLLATEHPLVVKDLAIDEEKNILIMALESGGFGNPGNRFEFSEGAIWTLNLNNFEAKKLIGPLLAPERIALVNPAKKYDFCPDDPNKIDGGACGCGVADTDLDLDGVLDCSDQCQSDPAKSEGGICGCGVADADMNNNGKIDCTENFSTPVNPITPKKPSKLSVCKKKATLSCSKKFKNKKSKKFKQCVVKTTNKCNLK